MGVYNGMDEDDGPIKGARLYVYDYTTFPDGEGDDDVLRTVELAGFPYFVGGGDGEGAGEGKGRERGKGREISIP